MLLERVADRSLVNSLKQMENLQQRLNQLLLLRQAGNGDSQFPPLNVWVSEHGAIVEAEVPGIEPSHIDISIISESLTIKGSRHKEDLKEDEVYHRQERGYGSFARTIELPFRIESEKVEAKFKGGVLRITLPRAESDKPKKIVVKSFN